MRRCETVRGDIYTNLYFSITYSAVKWEILLGTPAVSRSQHTRGAIDNLPAALCGGRCPTMQALESALTGMEAVRAAFESKAVRVCRTATFSWPVTTGAHMLATQPPRPRSCGALRRKRGRRCWTRPPSASRPSCARCRAIGWPRRVAVVCTNRRWVATAARSSRCVNKCGRRCRAWRTVVLVPASWPLQAGWSRLASTGQRSATSCTTRPLVRVLCCHTRWLSDDEVESLRWRVPCVVVVVVVLHQLESVHRRRARVTPSDSRGKRHTAIHGQH